MMRAIKIWFCMAVAMIAASIADPLVESASNARWFGPGNFTDHSSWDIVPAIAAGVIFVALHCYTRVRGAFDARQARQDWHALTGDAFERGVVRLVPLIFAAQILALYVMETSEQLVVYGHVLGGTIWLGAPIVVSLIAHAIACGVLALVAARAMRVLAAAVVRLVHMVRALARLHPDARPVLLKRSSFDTRHRHSHVLGRFGERAPPILAA